VAYFVAIAFQKTMPSALPPVGHNVANAAQAATTNAPNAIIPTVLLSVFGMSKHAE